MRSHVAQPGVAGRHQLRGVIARAGTPTPANEKGRKPDSCLGRFPETTTRVSALEALVLGAGRRPAAGRTKRLDLPQSFAVRHVASLPRSPPGGAVVLRIPHHHVPDADSDRAGLPGTGPAPRRGASEDLPDEELTQEEIGQRW
jgi:hypothetical protein